MKKAKRLVTVAVAVALVFCMFSMPVSAISNADKAEMFVETANQTIEIMVTAAVAVAEHTPSFVDRIIADNLKLRTDAIAAATIEKCAALGVTVVCEYKIVYVDTVVVYIDPLKVC